MNIVPRFTLGDLDLTEYPFAALFGGSPGNPLNVAEVVDSMIQDGEIISSSRTSNRLMKWTVLIEESDMSALADAEALLALEADKQRNTFTVDPGDGYGAVTVFDTFRTQVEFVRDDVWEEQGYRRYDLSIPALPFGRSDTDVVDEALTSSASPSTVTIADGSSATGWTSPDGTITSSGGALVVPTAFTGSTYDGTGWRYDSFSWRADRTLAATDFTVTPYLSFDTLPDVSAGVSYAATATAFVDGSETTLLSAASSAGPMHNSFLVADPSATALSLRGTVTVGIFILPWTEGGGSPPPLPTVTVDLDNVARSNMAPSASSTGRESVRTIEVQGSARTEGRLYVTHETAGLGDVLLYTGPEGGAIPLRQWRSSGAGETTDATTVSGKREALSSPAVFNVPTAGMPRGAYVAYALVDMGGLGTDATFTVEATTLLGATELGSQSTSSDGIPFGSDWTIVPIGDLILPVTDVPEGSIATAKITLTATDPVDYDEAWLFYAGDGASLTQVACGAGTPAAGTVHNRCWIDTASQVSPTPAIWVGTEPDRSDAMRADAAEQVASWGTHEFPAGPLWGFLVTTGATFAGLSLRHFPRWHSHARNL